MITLVFDTETTGFPSKTLPVDHPNQARIMQIAMLLLDGDKEVGCFYGHMFPSNWPTPHSAATAAHGITVENCERLGVSVAHALAVFDSFVNAADKVVAHNLKFDSQLIDIECGLLSSPIKYDWTAKSFGCTMEILTPLMGLKRANGAPKWPNLGEALDFCEKGAVIDNAHDALSDVRATAKVWRHLVNLGLAPV